MTLIKTSLLNAIAVVIKMITMLGINKVLALYVGPAGYAAIGNFQNAAQMITTLASGAINTGVVKYTAEYRDDEDKQRQLWRTAGTLGLIGSLVMGVVVAIFSKKIAMVFLHDESYSIVFNWFSVALLFYIFNTLLLAILNGKREISRYIIASITGSIFSLIVTSVLAVYFGINGALIALAIHPSFAFIATLYISYKVEWFKFSYLFGVIDKVVMLNLSKYAAMAIVSAVCMPVSHIFIRNYLGDTFGLDSAGYWEAMWRLSTAYLLLVTTTLSVYYLPKLSELKCPGQIRNEIVQGYKVIIPFVSLCGLAIYFFRDLIIGILFTDDFLPVRNLFAWQIFGDTLKVASWILSYLMLGKAMVKLLIFTEIVFSISFCMLTVMLTNKFGLEGVCVAHALNYTIYLIFCLYVFSDYLFPKLNKS